MPQDGIRHRPVDNLIKPGLWRRSGMPLDRRQVGAPGLDKLDQRVVAQRPWFVAQVVEAGG